jgi:hypothetical protein
MIDTLIEILEANKASQKALAEEEAHCKQELYEAMQNAGIDKQESDYGTVRIQRRYEKDYGNEIKVMEAELKAAKKLKDDLGDFIMVSFKDSLVYMPPKDIF